MYGYWLCCAALGCIFYFTNLLDTSVGKTHLSYILKACTAPNGGPKPLCHFTFHSFNSQNKLKAGLLWLIPDLGVAVFTLQVPYTTVLAKHISVIL